MSSGKNNLDLVLIEAKPRTHHDGGMLSSFGPTKLCQSWEEV